ncbi:hypothetical protein PVAND_008419 [Polypedilum vanderplanki]|uniref:Peptidase C1A papain C-terminal domain-containing protein n=1 Tax=Polypedilum vanderplanki TaxID=319348 RepID=A0A9J6CA66_POLVA|nr:hypothetical protein PVAND_008419 [Polypedilum vanderplanki]
MKCLTISILIIFSATIFGSKSSDEKEPHRRKDYKHVFNDEYRKYLDAHPNKNHHEWSEEIKFRREQKFNQTLKWIENHKKNRHPYEVGITRFADVLEEDLTKYLGLDESQNRQPRSLPIINPLDSSPPASLDYSSYAPPITDQAKCGACWAFATVGMLSTVYGYTTNRNWNSYLSEQFLIDCDPVDSGCKGGFPSNTLMWLKGNQLSYMLDSISYPYISGITEKPSVTGCKTSGLNYVPLSMSTIFQANVNGDVDYTKQILWSYGPVITGMSVPSNCTAFHAYKSGVYVDNCNCVSNCTLTNHAVVLMGYGTENGLDYWLFRNSWGTTWGINGYMKIERSSLNKCNMACILIGIEP